MIVAERIKSFNDIDDSWFVDHALQEFKEKPREELEKSEVIWLVSRDEVPLMVAGLVRRTVTGRPIVWVMLCKPFLQNKTANIRATQKLFGLLQQRYGRVEAWVREDFEPAMRFAKHFTFEPIRSVQGYVNMVSK